MNLNDYYLKKTAAHGIKGALVGAALGTGAGALSKNRRKRNMLIGAGIGGGVGFGASRAFGPKIREAMKEIKAQRENQFKIDLPDFDVPAFKFVPSSSMLRRNEEIKKQIERFGNKVRDAGKL